ncbi:hypothetical protein U1Q18_006932, partial [Sarracenia purpurea var. burkii]
GSEIEWWRRAWCHRVECWYVVFTRRQPASVDRNSRAECRRGAVVRARCMVNVDERLASDEI